LPVKTRVLTGQPKLGYILKRQGTNPSLKIIFG
jgi:hypothetical protein